ncbi:Hypothetical predicted protein [Pelobates cultripes]|uniref:Uncharacterized protein n=1 Tax=Pelobates cultripes TaxID=61616 RepID=A0AAD1R891_PELCU|nr:Hypothetical predicted protein [Pelobates cultripes]
MRASRIRKDLPAQYNSIQLYADLSAQTLKKRKEYKEITDALRSHEVPYRWGHPVRLLIHKNGAMHVITSLADGRKALQKWGIQPQNQAGSNNDPQPSSENGVRCHKQLPTPTNERMRDCYRNTRKDYRSQAGDYDIITPHAALATLAAPHTPTKHTY